MISEHEQWKQKECKESAIIIITSKNRCWWLGATGHGNFAISIQFSKKVFVLWLTYTSGSKRLPKISTLISTMPLENA